MKKIIILLCCWIGLTACTTAPSGARHFDLCACDIKQASLDLGPVAPSGNIHLDGNLREGAGIATRLKLHFGEEGSAADTRLTVSDETCNGVYQFALTYRDSDNVEFIDYFSWGLRWGTPLHLSIEWRDGNNVTIVLNGEEAKILHLKYPVQRFSVETEQGIFSAASIDYTPISHRSSR